MATEQIQNFNILSAINGQPRLLANEEKKTTNNPFVRIGIDVGSRNMAFTIIDHDNTRRHVHVDITRGYAYSHLEKHIYKIIDKLLEEVIFDKYAPDTTCIYIENQLNKNRICLNLQTIIRTLLYTRKYTHVMCVNPRKKYEFLKNLIGRTPLKSDLTKYISLDMNACTFRQLEIATLEFHDRKDFDKRIKYDDLIDSMLIIQQ
jgi:hypothetical protein